MTDAKSPPITIRPARSAEDLAEARRLFQEYAASLDFSLCFQGFDEELEALPGKYAGTERGEILLGLVGDHVAGVVALRDLGDNICEMKRLYAEPLAREYRLGRKLADAIIETARGLGYAAMRLDTLKRMQAANRLYDQLGFLDIPPYIHNPMPDVRYRELKL